MRTTMTGRTSGGFSLVEMLIVLGIVLVVSIMAYSFCRQAFFVPAERSRLRQTKEILLSALNQYYINHYDSIQADPDSYASIPLKTLLDEHYLNSDDLYDQGRITYLFGVQSATGSHPIELKLKLSLSDAQSLQFLKPTSLSGKAAIWLVIPSYRDIAGKLKFQAVNLARFYDDKKM